MKCTALCMCAALLPVGFAAGLEAIHHAIHPRVEVCTQGLTQERGQGLRLVHDGLLRGLALLEAGQ